MTAPPIMSQSGPIGWLDAFLPKKSAAARPKRPNVTTLSPDDGLYDPKAADQARKLFGGTFADSMYALAGTPKHVSAQWGDPGEAGSYNIGRDSIAVAPDLFRIARPVGSPAIGPEASGSINSPEGTLAHEMAHRMFIRADLANALGADDARPGAKELLGNIRSLGDSVRASGGTVPGYAGTNYQEHAAEAVRNAVQLLRMTDTSRAGPELSKQIEPMRQRFEQAVPGTSMALRYLLTQPIYQGHPLRVSQELHGTAPDATAVATPRRLALQRKAGAP